ncbi:erythropoietin receptor [Aplochiton taeniatus]
MCAQKPPIAQGTFENKVSLLLKAEVENPKCFAEGMRDLTCFWEEDEERAAAVDQYSFTYAYQKEDSNRCLLRTFPVAGNRRLYVCQLHQTQMFVPLDIQVHRDDLLLYNRSLLIELVCESNHAGFPCLLMETCKYIQYSTSCLSSFVLVLLNPPTNVVVNSTEQPGHLRVTWQPPPLKYMDDSMMYEVSYAVDGSHRTQVEEVRASSEVFLRGLEPGTRYKVRVRVKLDGISYSGYWSAWTEPVFMETLPAALDPLIVTLVLIISVILTLLSLTVLLSHRSFLIKKIWPIIPTPDNKFRGLFTVYGGNFQEWMGQENGGLWFSPIYFYSEVLPSPLEVLSEVSLGHSLPPPPLSPKCSQDLDEEGDKEEEDEVKRLRQGNSASTESCRKTSQDHWEANRLRALHLHTPPCSQSSLLESHDAYVTLDASQPHGGDEPLDDILEETAPLQVLFASGRTSSSESRSDLGSSQQSSGSGRLSSQFSFDYPNHTWPPKGPSYTYMAVADSGVSMDYSPMSSSRIDDTGKGGAYPHTYKNDIIPNPRRPTLTRQSVLYNC